MSLEQQERIDQLFEECVCLAPEEREAVLRHADFPSEVLNRVRALLVADASLSADAAEPFRPVQSLNVANLLPEELHPNHLIGAQLGPYEITRCIGSGGCGTVYAAVRSEQFEQVVAVKIIRVDRSSSRAALRRFEVERQVLANLQHENIARLLDGGCTEQGLPYFVMELIDGLPITGYCDQQCMKIEARLQLFMQVCRAVSHAHRMGVVHRDIKPGNIMVTKDGTPKLVDFGIAKILDLPSSNVHVTSTMTNQTPMTPAYASPEQFYGESVTVASDIYSLGIVLYELLVGRHPFQLQGLPPHEIAHLALEKEPSRPSVAISKNRGNLADTVQFDSKVVVNRRSTIPELRRRYKGDLDHVVLKALRKEPRERYETAHQFADDVQNYLDGSAVIARDGSFAYRAKKFLRKHAILVTAATFVLVALVAGLISTLAALQIAKRTSDTLTSRVYELQMMAVAQECDQGHFDGAARRLVDVGPNTRFEHETGFEYRHLWNRVAEKARWPMLPDAGSKILHADDDLLIFAAKKIPRVQSWSLANAISGDPPDVDWGPDVVDYSRSWSYAQVACSVERGLLTYFQNRGSGAQSSSTLFLVDWDTGAILDKFEMSEAPLLGARPHAMPVAFAPDGRTIVSIHTLGTVCFWNVTEDKKIEAVAQIPSFGHQIYFSPDGTRFAVVSRKGTLHVWNLESRDKIWEVEQESSCGCWTKDGSKVICGSLVDGVRVYDAQDGQLLNHVPAFESIKAITIADDNRRLAIGRPNGPVLLYNWDVSTHNPQLVEVFRGHQAEINSLTFVDSGRVLVTSDQDDCVGFWPVERDETNRERFAMRAPAVSQLDGHGLRIWDITFHPRGEFYATTSSDETVKLWNVQDDRLIREFELGSYGHTVSFSRGGKLMATGEFARRESNVTHSRLWDLDSGKQLKVWEDCFWFFFHRNLDLVAHPGPDDSRMIAEFPSMKPVVSIAPSPDFPDPHGFRLSNGSTSFAQTDQHGRFQISIVNGNRIARTVTHSSANTLSWAPCEFSPDDSMVATGTSEGTVKLWNVETGDLIRQMNGHGPGVYDLAFHPSGRRLASADAHGGVKIWEMPSGKHRLTLQASIAGVGCLAFSPDGNTLAAGGRDGRIFVWRASSHEEYQSALPVVHRRYLD